MSKAIFLAAGDCSRCTQPFASRGALFMVLEREVAWKVLDGVALVSPKTVPVCEGCATADERKAVKRQETCQGCGHPMLVVHEDWKGHTCSKRCRQRVSRVRRRLLRPAATCQACGTKFIPAKAHAKFCSGACRQRAHRLRVSSAPAVDSLTVPDAG